MSPHDDKNTLNRLWDDVPVGTPPIDDLVRGGKTMRRRARLRVAGGAAALTLAVVAGSTVAANTVFDNANPRPDGEVPAAANAPTAPTGKRLVGMGRVVVAVPAGWGTNELDGCRTPSAATVWFEPSDPAGSLTCAPVLHRVPSVKFTTLDTEAGKAAVDAAKTSMGDGLIFRGSFVCPPTTDCNFAPDTAPQYIVVPSQGVAITLFGPERSQDLLDAVADSVQILPEGYTTVPYVDGNYPVTWNAAIAEAGLVPDSTLPPCGPNDSCVTNPPIRPEPGPGTVAAVGSTVTLFPSAALGTPVDLPTSEWEPGDDSHTALSRGQLGMLKGCVVLLPPQDPGNGGFDNDMPGTIQYWVWPAGYTASVDGDDKLTVYDAVGVAIDGQGLLEAGGAYHSVTREMSHPCLPGPGNEVFYVQSAVTAAP